MLDPQKKPTIPRPNRFCEYLWENWNTFNHTALYMILPALTSKHLTQDPWQGVLLQKLGIEDITWVLHCRRLRRYGHVQRATSCIKTITNFQIPGTRKKGRHWKTWSECVKADVNECGLAGVDPLDRDAWRASVRNSLVLPTQKNGTRTAT